MHAVILAGGKGVRLRPYTTTLPKPLVPIGDEYAILEIMLHQLSRQGFRSVTLAIGHLGHLIRSYVGDGSRWGLRVDYAVEEAPLGTIGPLLTMRDRLPAEFLVANGDILTDIDFAALLLEHAATRPPLTVATYARKVAIDFGVLTTQAGRVIGFSEKPTLDYQVSMGVYGVSNEALAKYEPGRALGFDQLVLNLLAEGRHPREYRFDGYWLDIGRPDDYDRANAEFSKLRPQLMEGRVAVTAGGTPGQNGSAGSGGA
ncbi:sugar phosphate nucleotidyltransferase [Actinomadura syzygii]|uniref:NTP transferase domain-containing protein n=1 Tax=Actinomadura syzygii TaxID=1427538 RepID=A0A5D0UI61_9ACTN|nr:sugar phosphate nucleotidyltransferase [Actinomadura syzygii]TYC17476.1 NTP transferase domain-containing protein [Actinomadura syzygii]